MGANVNRASFFFVEVTSCFDTSGAAFGGVDFAGMHVVVIPGKAQSLSRSLRLPTF
jgi:hypothetical protein